MRDINIYGVHRGATELLKRLPDEARKVYPHEWRFADPKVGRAKRGALELKQRFPEVDPIALEIPAREALSRAGDTDVIALTLDSIGDISDVLKLRKPGQPMLFQIAGRAPGGSGAVRIGLAGTLLPEDAEAADNAWLLLDAFDGMSAPASSRQITGFDPLTGLALAPMRAAVALRTARHSLEVERAPEDLTGGPLGVVLGGEMYPLVCAEVGLGDRYGQRTSIALDSASHIAKAAWKDDGVGGAFAVVAVIVREAPQVEFFKIVRSRSDRRRVDGMTPFAAPADASKLQPALFTD